MLLNLKKKVQDAVQSVGIFNVFAIAFFVLMLAFLMLIAPGMSAIADEIDSDPHIFIADDHISVFDVANGCSLRVYADQKELFCDVKDGGVAQVGPHNCNLLIKLREGMPTERWSLVCDVMPGV